MAVDAHNCPDAQASARRISVTPAGMASANARLLVIRGQRKREVFERAVASGDVLQWPILAALAPDNRAPLQVYWCP